MGFFSKLVKTLAPTRSHVHAILNGAKDTLKGKRIFGGTPLGTKLSNLVTGRHDKPIADQYGGMTADEKKKFVADHGGDPNSLGYSQELHAIGSAIGSMYAGNYAGGQLSQLFGNAAGAAGGAGGGAAGSVGGTAGGAAGAAGAGAGGMAGYADWANLILQAYGAYQSSQGAKGSQNTLADAMRNATTTLGPSTITGPGGINGTVYNNGEGGTYGLGNLQNANNYLTQLGTNSVQNALSSGGLPANITQANNALQNASPVAAPPDTTGMQSIFGNVLNQNIADMNRGPMAPGLAQQAYAGAQTNLADASRGYGDFFNSTLQNLRDQAQPFETRAYDQLQNDQFSRGQMGTSGGALQTEAFARGLGQNDLQRQLTATQLAQQNQQNSLNVGNTLAGIGNNQNQLDESLLQSAFNRFGTTAGLANDLTQQRFGNSVLANQTGYDRAASNLNNQINFAQLPIALQGQQLNLGTQALNGQQALNSQGLQQFMAALQASQAAANARIGSGTNVSGLAGISAQLPNQNDIWGQVLTGIGSRIGNQNGNGSLGNIFSGLFGGTSSPKSDPGIQPVYNDYGNDPRAVGY